MSEQRQLELNNTHPHVHISCKGDLSVEGWEQPQVTLEGQGDTPSLERADDWVRIEANSSCTIQLPKTSTSVEIVSGGRTKVRGVHGTLHLIESSGDLLLDDVGSVEIGTSGGQANLMNVHGDVQVQGRAQGDLSAQGVTGSMSVAGVNGRLTLKDVSAVQVTRASGDLVVQNASAGITVGKANGKVGLDNIGGPVTLQKAQGDAVIRDVQGSISCGRVNGRLYLANVDEVTIRRVQGDLLADGVSRAFACQKTQGRAVLRNVAASISLGGVAGDLLVEDCGGMLSANAGGRAVLKQIAGNVQVNAGGDIRCTLAKGLAASVKAVCGGALTIETGSGTITRGPGIHTFTVSPDEPLALASDKTTGFDVPNYGLVAGGAIHLTAAETVSLSRSIDEEMSELGAMGEEMGELGAMGAQIAAAVSHRISHTLQKKLKQKLRTIGKRVAGGDWTDARSWDMEFHQASDLHHTPFADVGVELDHEPALDPPSDEERMIILRMLEDGKISADEAERLLNALGNQV